MKAGIVTLYYDNWNYGAQLQAYALRLRIEKRGFFAEQIQYNWKKFYFFDALIEKPGKILYYFFSPKKCIERIKLLFDENRNLKRHTDEVPGHVIREKSCAEFRMSILHTERVYTKKNIALCAKNYDVFVVGSDQVWTKTDDTFYLSFVKGKKKVAYAASCAKTKLENRDICVFRKYLSGFDAISVREQDSVALLQPYAGKNKVEWVLDPTMLLTREDWDEICPKQLVEGKYMFCYFLGPDKNMRDVAQEYAKKHDLKLVTLPHLMGKILADVGFGDEQLYDISPADFLSLIKYADCIFTDSFHGSVFSLLYCKKFFVFSRLDYPNSDNRIISLLSMFDAEERFLNTTERMTVNYVEQLRDLDYSQQFPKFEEMKKSSMEFLEKALR